MKTIDEVIKNKLNGLYYGNRLILPFHAYFLKVIVDDEIIIDFSPSAKGINIVEEKNFTSLYLLDYKDLKSSVSKYEAVKILAVDKGKNIFDTGNHKKIVVYLKEKHKVRIEEADEDILFIE
jgi:signal-transduction protein with cAMP-binding, CBS, and nucleotidyltransferase domain